MLLELLTEQFFLEGNLWTASQIALTDVYLMNLLATSVVIESTSIFSSGRPRGGETLHSFPHFGPFSKRSGLSSVLDWDRGSLFVFGRMTGRAWDACVSRFPACSHYRWTRRGMSIRPGTMHGPRPYPKHYPTSGQGIFSGCRSYLRIGNHRISQMRGFGASLFSLFELVYKRLRDLVGPEDSAFLRRWRLIWKSCLPMKI